MRGTEGPPRWIFWHRRDLRLADNLGLRAAAEATPALTGVFVLDPAILQPADAGASAPGHPPMAPARLWFLAESLRELQRSWSAAGSRLLILRGDPAQLLPALAERLNAEAVVWNRDVEPAGRERDRRVAAALQAGGRRVMADWDQLLVPPERLLTGSGDPYRVYGPYRRRWFAQLERPDGVPVPVAAPSGLVDAGPSLSGSEAGKADPMLPQASAELAAMASGFAGHALCPCRPGEAAAIDQLQRFCGASGPAAPLLDYEPGRNLPGAAGTSGLSAALKFGTLSPRQAWQASAEALTEVRSEEGRQSIEVWRQELAWREFYQQALFHFPELAEGPYRSQWRAFPWDNDPGHFQAWRDGLTGVPIVDAAMRQLRASGWMHNRCRMIVASFLVKDLICDWRWGERTFMEHLVDGDLAANNGGWQWSASSGMDPKPLRIFNPYTQAARFDPDGDYIRTWLPELAHVASSDLVRGTIAPLERRGYPEPVVDHAVQQRRFKALHAGLR
ncbi:deoxyribodipyrimidine photolyase [Synechococcus sp. RSCCF101]|uniref:cryptochrome/photolyase family protein n=1 Tax=Synechococcus sp. RSCCF101 TaxID=2511069 RepID=UPI0012446EBA|nr:FAD-binding domain-containing protein [Synechococcus sp. RSCCF101]QEY32306.1 deoxyribodipyrimidine photolyase [Synechococcus sp. RSCCF101]